jgi:hypothetical protein
MNAIPIVSEERVRGARATIQWIMALFVAWFSFAPEPILAEWHVFRYTLALCVCLSWMRHGFSVREYFFGRDTRVVWAYLIFLGLCVPFAYARWYVAWKYLEIAASAAAIYLVVTREYSFSSLRRLFAVLVWCAVGVIALGVYEMAFRQNPLYVQLRVQSFCYTRFVGSRMMSTMIHPNVLGMYVVACLPFAWYFRVHGFSRITRAWGAAVAAGCVAAAAFTCSRGSWLALLAMSIVYACVRRRYRTVAATLVAIMLVIGISSMPRVPQALRVRLSADATWKYFIGYRVAQMATVAHAARAYPFTGLGIDNYRTRFFEFAPERALRYEFRIPDSLYLWHLAETGIPATVAFAVLVVAMLARVRRTACRGAGLSDRAVLEGRRGLSQACGYSMVGYLVSAGTFDAFLWRMPLYVFWFLCAAVSVLAYSRDE